MTAADPDLLEIERGSVAAPAGCGKTQLIADALSRHREQKPALILTHTNAGVAALRARLDRKTVPRAKYRLSTLDGWSLRLLSTFPARSGVNRDSLAVRNPGNDYPEIKRAAAVFLSAGHLRDVFSATYSRLIVDEYQDCGKLQHAAVCQLAEALPTVVLGDPMQEIFNWQAGHPHWEDDVCPAFPPAGELKTPWRWKLVGEEGFGEWLLWARRELASGRTIDLRAAPPNVTWIRLDGADDQAKQRQACLTESPRRGGEVLIMTGGRQKDLQRKMAKETPGAVTVEAVDLTDVTDFARRMTFGLPGDLETVLDFASEVTAGIGATEMLDRIDAIMGGAPGMEADTAELAAIAFKTEGTPAALVRLFTALEGIQGARTYRPEILEACINALRSCGTGEGASFLEAATRIREQNRLLGRKLPQRSVGSPLLLKGLEADVAVILDAAAFDPVPAKNRKNLYVAITRGSRALVVCSRSPVIG